MAPRPDMRSRLFPAADGNANAQAKQEHRRGRAGAAAPSLNICHRVAALIGIYWPLTRAAADLPPAYQLVLWVSPAQVSGSCPRTAVRRNSTGTEVSMPMFNWFFATALVLGLCALAIFVPFVRSMGLS